MEKMDGNSLNINEENISKLKDLFPNVVTDGKIDFDMLRMMLDDDVEESREKYQFTWNGKGNAIKTAQSPSVSTLRPIKEKSKDWNTTQNLYIEGDNLEVLKQLQKTFHNKVKMIYIDPPYNTGHDFVYKDDFTNSIRNYEEQTGQSFRTNPETSGRFHTDWLNMMFPRLLLARNLLKDDGVIFISIDDNELDSLKKICDEIFGERNYVNVITVVSKNSAGASGGGEDKRLKKNCEYILVYTKDYSSFVGFNGPFVYTEMSELIQQYIEEGKSWKYTSVLLDGGDKVYIGTTEDGDGNEIKIYERRNVKTTSINSLAKKDNLSIKEAYKKYGVNVFRTTNAQTSIRTRVKDFRKNKSIDTDYLSIEYIPRSGKNKGHIYEQIYKDQECNLLVWLKDTSTVIGGELYKKDLQGTLWDYVGETKNLTHEGEVYFPNGKKPVKLIKQIISMCTSEKDIVMDFFSGSATTAHSCFVQNMEDGNQRPFILVQLPEIVESNGGNSFPAQSICDIGEERIRRAGEKIKKEWEEKNASGGLLAEDKEFPVDIGFKVFRLDSSNIEAWDNERELDNEGLLKYSNEIFKEGRSKEDVLYEIMLKYGIFDREVSEININGKTMYQVGKRYMIVCLEDNLTEEDIYAIGKKTPNTVVFKESGFKDDNAKINAVYNLEKAGVEDIKCI